MSEVVYFTGGKRCAECDEQIDPRRLRARPGAKRCVSCEALRERRIHANLEWMRDGDIAIIRR